MHALLRHDSAVFVSLGNALCGWSIVRNKDFFFYPPAGLAGASSARSDFAASCNGAEQKVTRAGQMESGSLTVH